MAYVKTTWQTGDVITAEKLNNMEGGIEAHDPLIISVETNEQGDRILSETWQTIHDALVAGRRVLTLEGNDGNVYVSPVLSTDYFDNPSLGIQCGVLTLEVSQGTATGVYYSTSSADGYPTILAEP